MLLTNIHDKGSSTVKQIYKFKIIWTEWIFNYCQSQISWTCGNPFLFLYTAGVIFPRESFSFIFDMKKNNPIVFFLQKKSNLSTARGGGSFFSVQKWPPVTILQGSLYFPLYRLLFSPENIKLSFTPRQLVHHRLAILYFIYKLSQVKKKVS